MLRRAQHEGLILSLSKGRPDLTICTSNYQGGAELADGSIRRRYDPDFGREGYREARAAAAANPAAPGVPPGSRTGANGGAVAMVV